MGHRGQTRIQLLRMIQDVLVPLRSITSPFVGVDSKASPLEATGQETHLVFSPFPFTPHHRSRTRFQVLSRRRATCTIGPTTGLAAAAGAVQAATATAHLLSHLETLSMLAQQDCHSETLSIRHCPSLQQNVRRSHLLNIWMSAMNLSETKLPQFLLALLLQGRGREKVVPSPRVTWI